MEKQKKKRDNNKRTRNIQLALRLTKEEATTIDLLKAKTGGTKTDAIMIAIKEYLNN